MEDSTIQKSMQKDLIRDNYLLNLELKILRFSDRDVLLNTDSILERIFDFLKSPPTPL